MERTAKETMTAKIVADTWVGDVKLRYSKREWTFGVQYLVQRGMGEGDIRNHLGMLINA